MTTRAPVFLREKSPSRRVRGCCEGAAVHNVAGRLRQARSGAEWQSASPRPKPSVGSCIRCPDANAFAGARAQSGGARAFPDAAMICDDEADRSPHPFDIMALEALYQTVNP